MKKKRKSLKAKIATKSKKGTYKTVRKSSLEDVLLKAESLCVGQKFKKLSVVLGITEEDMVKICKTLENFSLENRLSQTDFEILKPTLKTLIQEILQPLPEKAIIKQKKRKSRVNIKSTSYTKLLDHKGDLHFISTNM